VKKVLITGANRGIGFEVAKQMAEFGYFVYLGSRNKKKGQMVVDMLNEMGLSNIECLSLDISDSNSIINARTALGEKINSLDVLINNAGSPKVK